jgi:type IV pilus assembly protein PilA
MKKRMKWFTKQFRYGQKGFTLVELLVVIAILGVIAAVAVPNVGKFIGKGKTEAAETELHNVQTSVMAAMADAGSAAVAGGDATMAIANFGDLDEDQSTAGVDCLVYTGTTADYYVGDYVTGGADQVQGSYIIGTDGTVAQDSYPGLP